MFYKEVIGKVLNNVFLPVSYKELWLIPAGT